MITREADYALRAVIYLAKHQDQKYCPTSKICDEMQIPYRFLRKISRKIVDSGLAIAQRGKQGGLSLAIAPQKISLLNILQIFDPRAMTLNQCCKDPNSCSRHGFCEAHDSFVILQKKLEKEFEKIKISDLIKNNQ
jgi:Rrf2 family protein